MYQRKLSLLQSFTRVELWFYGPVNTSKVMSSRSVNPTTLFLDRLRPSKRLTSTVHGPPPIGASRNRWAAWCFRGLAGDRTVLVNCLEGLSPLTLPRKSLVLVSLQGLSVIYLKSGKNPTNSEACLQND